MKKNGYVSGTTKFINEFIKENPEIKSEQKQLRATWWDKSDADIAEEEKLRQTNLKRDGYEYFDYSKKSAKN